MLRRLLLLAALLSLTTAALAADNHASAIAGVWRTKTGGYVQIYRDNGHWVGRVVGSTDGKPRYDSKNPDKAERGRRLLGVVVLKGLDYDGDHSYAGGRIYDPDNGKTYSAKASLVDANDLHVRGYIGISLIGKTQTWHRIAPKAKYVRQYLLHQPTGPASAH